jgi:ATP-dependent Lon protease
MEVLELPGYIVEDKIHIAFKYLIPRQIDQNGLKTKHISFRKTTIRRLISEYTREAGVRNLEREIGSICRKVARDVAEGNDHKHAIDPEALSEYLGPTKFYSEVKERTSEPGVATGVAWTATGGDILFVEATKMRGNKTLTLTGQLGDVMRESAQAALSYIRTRAEDLGLEDDLFEKYDIHVHVPEGAIPKDGPSAGVTIATSLVSMLSGRPIRHDVAMTGEITLRGKVLPVGGIKEKVLAARRAGISHMILPEKNEKDLSEIPEDTRQKMKFHFVNSADQVFEISLLKKRKTKQK